MTEWGIGNDKAIAVTVYSVLRIAHAFASDSPPQSKHSPFSSTVAY
jgi:hypothetical protein